MDNLERSRLLTEIYFYVIEKRQGTRSRSIFNSQTQLTTSKKHESTFNPLISFADMEVDAPQDPFENLMRERGLLPPKYTYIPKFCLHFRQFTNTHPRLYPLPHSHHTGELGPHVGAFFKCNDAWVPPPKTVGPRHQYSL